MTKTKEEFKTIAVWGTLCKGHGNHHLIKDEEFLGEDIVPDALRLGLSLSIVKSLGDNLQVEVYKVKPETYKEVDKMEQMFRYFPKTMKLKSGKKAVVWWNNF